MKQETGNGPKDGAARPPAGSAAHDASRAEAEALQERIKNLTEERDRLKAELADVRDKHLRARADYENLVKRVAKETQDSSRAAKGGILLRLLGLFETLEKAVKDAESRTGVDAKGLKLLLEEWRKFLKDEGIREIDAIGHAFNYKHHQAVDRVESADKPEGTVVEVVQRGYLHHGDILRPALVKVAVPARKGAPKEAPAEHA